jgi:hypothetical protein
VVILRPSPDVPPPINSSEFPVAPPVDFTPSPVPLPELGHADTRMTEKHYAHLAPNYVADTIRANFPNLGISDTTNLVPFRAFKAPAPPSAGDWTPSWGKMGCVSVALYKCELAFTLLDPRSRAARPRVLRL